MLGLDPRLRGVGQRLSRQLDRERGAGARLALDADRSAMRLDDLARDVQPEPEPTTLARRLRLLVAVEDPLDVLGGDADPVIDDDQAS
jgi:hypothetical protein